MRNSSSFVVKGMMMITAVAVVIVAALTPTTSDGAPEAARTGAGSSPSFSAFVWECDICDYCESGGFGGHCMCSPGGGGATVAKCDEDGEPPCHCTYMDGTCGSAHTLCGPMEHEPEPETTEAVVDKLIAAVRQDGSNLRSTVEVYGASLEVNKGRGALQLRSCAGVIVAHIPLASEQVALLSNN